MISCFRVLQEENEEEDHHSSQKEKSPKENEHLKKEFTPPREESSKGASSHFERMDSEPKASVYEPKGTATPKPKQNQRVLEEEVSERERNHGEEHSHFENSEAKKEKMNVREYEADLGDSEGDEPTVKHARVSYELKSNRKPFEKKLSGIGVGNHPIDQISESQSVEVEGRKHQKGNP